MASSVGIPQGFSVLSGSWPIAPAIRSATLEACPSSRLSLNVSTARTFIPVSLRVVSTYLAALEPCSTLLPQRINLCPQTDDQHDPSWFPAAKGYTLQPGETATFVYEGTITLEPHMEDSPAGPINITIVPIVSASYEFLTISAPASNATAAATLSWPRLS